MNNIRNSVSLYGFVIIITLLVSCTASQPVTQSTTIEMAYKQWKDAALSNYQFTEQRNCFCIDRGPATITVSNKVVTAIKDANGKSVSVPNANFKTIDELFEYIRFSAAKNPARTEIKYNAKYGYPETIFFDFSESMADEEMGYTITGFSVN